MESGGKLLWAYHHPEMGEPYFHPLHAANGELLTELRPEDHPWHRGLWFCWKYINGVNYWEENRQTQESEGFTRVLATRRSIGESQQLSIEQELVYAPTRDGPAVLKEQRELKISPPDAAGVFCIDWFAMFEAVEAVELGRTPIAGEPEGKSWGGYAGLSLRLNKSTLGGSFLTDDKVLIQEGETQNVQAQWMSFNSPGGSGILILDHPGNLRSPCKWYLYPPMPFFSPAVLFDLPYTLAAGETLILRYRIVVSPEPISDAAARYHYCAWLSPVALH